VTGVGRRGELRRHWAHGRPVDGGWRPEVERLVRALFIVLTTEAVEACLLGTLVALRGPGRFGFQRAVHALVRAVLLRPPWRNSLMADAQLNPPHLELAQATERGGGKRCAVVGANGLGQTVLMEEALEDGACLYLLGRQPRCTAQEKAAVGVRDRQRVAIEPVAGTELALEVRRSDRIRDLGLQGHCPRMPVPTPALAGLTEPLALEERASGARRRKGKLGSPPH
jgi:hypothetical protein